MSLKRFTQFIFAFYILVGLIIQVFSVYVVMNSVKCKSFDNNFVNMTKCFTKPITRGITETTINMTFYREVTSMTAKFGLHKKSNNKYNPYLFQETNFDCCKFLLKKTNYPMVNYLFSQIETYTNLNHTCPIKDYIQVDRMRIDMKKLKWLPLANGDYCIITRWFVLGKEKFELDFFFSYRD